MKRSTEAILDKMEPRFVKKPARWQKKPPPSWLVPSAGLKPTEPYPCKLYLRAALGPGLAVDIVYLVSGLLPFIFLWYRFPTFFRDALFHRGREHSLLIGLLAHEGYYWLLPLGLVMIPLFSLLLDFPRWYFWNRRAARLLRETPQVPNGQSSATAADPTIWPPAPSNPPD